MRDLNVNARSKYHKNDFNENLSSSDTDDSITLPKKLYNKTTCKSSEYEKVTNISSTYPSYPSKFSKPVGFLNLGNTCYMNSGLQCLIATRLLFKYFYNRSHEKEINLESTHGSKGLLAHYFGELVQKVCQNNISSINLSQFKRLFLDFCPAFDGYEQHDAQEFLMIFLDAIHEDLNCAHSTKTIKEPDIDLAVLSKSNMQQLAADAWKRHLMKNKSFIIDLFQGQLSSSVTCMECSDILLKFEPFMYLSLPTVTNSNFPVKTLTEALEVFSSPESMSEKPCFFCSKCKKKVCAEKQLTLMKFPPVLIIHYKRFRYINRKFQKIESLISSPLENLNLKNFVSHKEDLIYDLYATLNHTGHTECGHYTATCMRDNQWYLFDDATVVAISSDKIINKKNYVLFYQRRQIPVKLSKE